MPDDESKQQLTPIKQELPIQVPTEEIFQLHAGVFNIVKKNLPTLQGVINGQVRWTPTQAKVYLGLLDKVMPNLNKTKVEKVEGRPIDELSMEELLAIVEDRAVATVPSKTLIEPLTAQEAEIVFGNTNHVYDDGFMPLPPDFVDPETGQPLQQKPDDKDDR